MNKLYFLFLLPFIFFTNKLVAQAPVISGFSPESAEPGTLVTINGSNFNASAANNTVFFGAVKATVISGTTSQLSVTVPLGANNKPITVAANGLTATSGKTFMPIFKGTGADFVVTQSAAASFTSPYKIAHSTPTSLITSDLDGDGKPDMVSIDYAGNFTTNTITIIKNTSTPGIISGSVALQIPTAAGAKDIKVADINGDGKPDLIVPRYNTSEVTAVVSIFINTSTTGSISFAAAQEIKTAVSDIIYHSNVIDLNNDGKPEIILSGLKVTILKNTSTGNTLSFDSGTVIANAGSVTTNLVFTDLDNDGKPDMAFTKSNPSPNPNSLVILQNTSTSKAFSFDAAGTYSLEYGDPYQLEVADMDGDGKTDLITISWQSNIVSIAHNTSTGATIKFSIEGFSVGVAPVMVSAGDLNGDGKPDLAIMNAGTHTISLVANNGVASTTGALLFKAPQNYAVDVLSTETIISDIDLDGAPDILYNGYFLTDGSKYYTSIIRNNMLSYSPPTITSFSPNTAKSTDTVTINGTNFTGTTAVSFGGVAARSFTVASTTKIVATVKSGASGDVIVTTPGGTVKSTGFIFDKSPVLTGINPLTGAPGTSITLTGGSFTGATAVSFGGVPAKSFIVRASDTITAIVGDGSSGAVSVTTPNGTITLGGFIYDSKPIITNISPVKGGAGATIQVKGFNFTGTTDFKFGGVAAASFTIISDTTITAVVGTGATGNVTATTPKGTATLGGFAFIAAPVLQLLSPASATVSNTITLTGTDLSDASAVSFGGVPAKSFTVNSATNITATLAANTLSGDVIVTTPQGTGKISGFKFYVKPAISYSRLPTFTAGIPITPLTVSNTGGAFDQRMYGKVNTIAGSGGYGKADGKAKDATFEYPLGVTSDKDGTIYVADASNNLIRKISVDGMVSTYAGTGISGSVNGPANTAQFQFPNDVAVDADGSVYVADSQNQKVRKITKDGTVSTLTLSIPVNFTYGLAISPSGIMYITNTYANYILRRMPDGTATNFVSVSNPYKVALDVSGNLYATQHDNAATVKITPAAGITTFRQYPDIGGVSIAVDELGNVYRSSETTYISQAPQSGLGFTVFAGKVSNSDASANINGVYHGIDSTASLSPATGMFYDGKGNLLIADPANGQIKSINLTGYYLDKPLPKGLVFDYSTGTISGTPTALTAATDYHISAYNAGSVGTTTITISVGKGQQVLAFDPVPAKTYGEADFSPAVSNNNGDPIIYTSSDTTVIKVVNNQLHLVKAGKSTITANQPANATFSASATLTQAITVNPAVLTVGVYNTIKAFGQADPKLFLKYDGFVNNDDTLSLTTRPIAKSATDTNSPAGDYPINISGGSSDRYTFNYVPGVMTVFPLPVITAANGATSFKLGDSVLLSVNPAAGYNYQWYLNAVPVTGAASSTFMAKQGGYYAVSINANNFTNYSATVQLTTAFFLPVDNFKLTITGAACKGDNNGSLNVTAKQVMNYTANVTGPNNFNNNYTFTDSFDVTSLPPGNYSVCISVPGQNYAQCFSAVVTEPKDLSVYTAINKTLNSVNLNMEGASNYTILLNGQTYHTTTGSIALPLSAGNNKLTVTTDKLCQGTFEKTITVADKIIPYPNPFRDQLSINLGNNNTGVAKVTIIDGVNGKLVYSNTYNNKQGVVQLDVSSLKLGMYVLNLSLDNNDMLFKLLKK